MKYNALAAPVAVVVPATGSAVPIFATPSRYRGGYRVTNSGTNTIYVQEAPIGTATPTAATVVGAYSFAVLAGQWMDTAAQAATAVFLAGAVAGAANVQELG